MVWSCGKNAKPTNAKTNYNSEDGRSKEKLKALYRMDDRERRGFKYNGNKNGQALVRDQRQWRMVVLKVKAHNRP